ncbi:MAG: isoprenylcysteine carboxylmethyltransferase family protein [Chromatiales bacterium]|jgi:protein-S-isoprenylcysteine O-methyltransferase Ste14|nr:isoprenylcysteine carboxylmethyltransferase family protein [Chromatiales bacterium]
MGKRTADLPPLPGLPGLIRELRYSEVARQGIGLLLMPFLAFFATPSALPFMAGAALVVLGSIVRMYASGFIVKNKQLATVGPYSVVRHPLYTGNGLILIGFVIACGVWWAIPLGILFWWLFYPVTIAYEDSKLERIFGDAWRQWSVTVPAVVPRRVWPRGGGGWSFMTSLRENFEPVVMAFTLACIGWIGTRV